MIILVTGGAGYIGSHTVKELARSGFEVLVFDNLSSGRREFIRNRPFVNGDLLDKDAVRKVFKSATIGAVLHFASLIQVGESYIDPRKYYSHNLVSSLNLLEAMLESGVDKLIFSSTAAVYGVPQEIPIPETHPLNPVNPYGQTKLVVERMLEDYGRAYGLKSISLRYFNAAGADSDGEMGECHDPETHLIPSLLLHLLGKTPRFVIHGDDFPTPDGTAVRDFIHVTDLAVAHVMALKALLRGDSSNAVNLGTNTGYSVRQVIKQVETVTGRKVPYEIGPRRKGDVPTLLASKEKARQALSWEESEASNLATIIETAWNWHRQNR